MQRSRYRLGTRLALATVVGALMTVSAHAQTRTDLAGQRLFLRCRTCHEVAPSAPNKVGPNLNGVAGRKAASVAGFNYSAAMRKSGVVWTDAALDKWLTRPTALVPGTTMVFVGMPKPEERAKLIAYLKSVKK